MLYKYALGATLRQRRVFQGLTLRDVSSKSHIALGYLSEIERGRKEASSQVLDLVSGSLGIETHALVMEAAVLLQKVNQ